MQPITTPSTTAPQPHLPVAAPRPKRGRRKKRPELSDEQRKALRALQNRAATRRSRERSRLRAEQLKNQLQRSLQQNHQLQRERDTLLYCIKRARQHATQPPATPTPRPNPMSLSVILNSHDEHPIPTTAAFSTPPSKLPHHARGPQRSPLSIASPTYAFGKSFNSQTP